MNCSRCGGPTRFVQQYQQSWCDSCQQYVGAAGTPGSPAARKQTNYWLTIGLPVGAVLILLGVAVFMFVRKTGDRFESYVKKSKTSESREMLRRMYQGASYYYSEEHYGDGLGVTTAQLPPAVGPVPAKGACCAGGTKCLPEPGQWDDPSWQALQFSLDRPFYFSYEFRPTGADGMVEFRAYGDLDCDGTYSTFVLSAQEQDGELISGEIFSVDPVE